MRYSELKENYSPERDEHNKAEMDDTLRVRLTLAHLSQIRSMKEYRKFEREKKMRVLKKIYGKQGEEGGDMGGIGDL